MRNHLRYASLSVIIVAALAVSGCGSKPEEKPAAQPAAAPAPAAQPATKPATPAATAVDAEALVKANCIGCHGDTLDGKGAQNKNLQKVGAKLTKDQIAAKITNGGGGMPNFKEKLKDNEISAIADWLAAKK